MPDVAALLGRLADLEAVVADLHAQLAESDARIAELERRLPGARRRAPGRPPKVPGTPDRRRIPHRQHPGTTRPEPPADTPTIDHDVRAERCPHCGAADLEDTGTVSEQLVEDIVEPRVEVHRYRCQHYRCRACQRPVRGRGERQLPGTHIGPRARLFVGYARAQLGLSLGKTCALFREWFGLRLSRAGALGQLRWGSAVFAPVVQGLLTVLQNAVVVHADETSWRIDGRLAWAWCFCNPQVAVYLLDRRRSAAVLREALGDSLPGVLVTDFYAAYNRLECRRQRCLVHLLRELHRLSDRLPARYVTVHLKPLTALFQDVLALVRRRSELSATAFAAARQQLRQRFVLLATRESQQADCRRIYQRLCRHRRELLVCLDVAGVPGENNAAERDIRSVAAARSDGGVNRTNGGATAFGRWKSVVRTCQKNGRSFVGYGLDVVRQLCAGQPLSLPAPIPTG